MMRRPPSSIAGGPVRRGAPRVPPTPAGPSMGDRLLWAAVFMGGAAGLIWVMWPIFSILLASAALAYLLDPVADRLEERGLARTTGISIIFAIAAALVVVFVFVVLPMIAAQFVELSGNVRGYIDNLVALAGPVISFIEEQTGHTVPLAMADLKAEVPELLSRLSPDAREGIQAFLGRFFASSVGLFTAILNLALMPIFTFYLLNEWDRIVAFAGSLVPPRHRARTTRLALAVDERLGAFVRGQVTVCGVLAVLYSVGLWLSGIDLAFTVGTLAGALFVVPYLGTVVGVGLGSVLCLMKFGVDVHLAYVAAAFAVPQFIESWYLTPKIVGDKVGLHPLVVMIALLAGGGLAGIWGMLLAIPLTAVADVLARDALTTYRSSSVFGGDA